MNSHDQFPFKFSIEFFSEFTYVSINCVGCNVCEVGPHMLEESDPSNGLPWMEHEVLEEYQFFCPEEKCFFTTGSNSREEIEFEIFDPEYVFFFFFWFAYEIS